MNFDPAGHSKAEVIAELQPVCLCVCVCCIVVCTIGSGLRQLESGLCFLTLRAGFDACLSAYMCVCVVVLTIWWEL